MIDCESNKDNILNSLHLWARENKVPLTLTLELTPFCNFKCVMCYVRLTKESAALQGEMLSVSQWLDIAQQAKDAGTLNLSLTGGEPFMYPGFWELYEKLNKMGFLISILTNGSMIDKNVIEKFKLYGMPSMIKMTLYGASDETYRKACGSSDGFSRVSEAINLLNAENVPVMLTSTVVKENAHDLKQMYLFAAEKEVPFKHTVSVVRSSRGSENTTATSRFEFADFSNELSLEYLEKSKFKWSDDPFAFCVSKNSSLFVTWHGHLQLCSFLNEPYVQYTGNLANDFATLNHRIDKIKNPVECVDCEWQEFCQRCPAILCSESGHPEKVDDDFCKMAKRLYEIYTIKKGI